MDIIEKLAEELQIQKKQAEELTEELRSRILAAETQAAVDDLYRPYRPKRRTRATIAKEKGLEPLANIILMQKLKISLPEEAKKYISEEKEVLTIEDAIAGAKDILAEMISDHADYRMKIRTLTINVRKAHSFMRGMDSAKT